MKKREDRHPKGMMDQEKKPGSELVLPQPFTCPGQAHLWRQERGSDDYEKRDPSQW